MRVYQKLLRVIKEKKAGFLVLLDPDRLSPREIADLAYRAEKGGADGILVGSSLLLSTHFDEATRRWTVRTDRGDEVSARFLILGTGCLSTARTPDFPGMADYKGATYHTGHWPHEGVDFSGMRVGVVGTGSSAIQAIPVIAEQAAHVTVFQRTPNYSIPSRNGPMTPDYEAEWKTE